MIRPNDGKGIEETDHSYMAGRNAKGYRHSGRLAISYRAKPVITIKPSNCTLGHLSLGNGNLFSYKNLHTKYS